tara:strand:- start:66 stop:1043 length:978 start_codon:yes stop_codon:yes gene_type:complete
MNVIKNLSLIILSIFLTLFFLEFFLRLIGHAPFKHLDTNSPHPSIYIQDNITGWSNKEGSFNVKIDEENIVQYNILKDGSRYSGFNSDSDIQKDKIILIGGSFTMGQAINDNETFAFKMQSKLEDYEVKNYGSGGFGTYQSYLKLKQLYSKFENIDYVLYFFVDHHEVRNIVDPSWLEHLSELSGKPVKLPFPRLDSSNKLIEYPPLEYMVLPLSSTSVIISKIQKKIMRLKLFTKNEKKMITKKILLKISDLTKLNKSNFIMVNLLSNDSDNNFYKEFAKKNEINYLNCRIELNDKNTVKNEGHPNNLANEKYSYCIMENIFNN